MYITNADQDNLMNTELEYSFEYTQEIFITSLLTLHETDCTANVEVLFDPVEGSIPLIWCVDIVNPSNHKSARFVIKELVNCFKQAVSNTRQLLNANPHFNDKTYLIAVGIEQALTQFNCPDW